MRPMKRRRSFRREATCTIVQGGEGKGGGLPGHRYRRETLARVARLVEPRDRLVRPDSVIHGITICLPRRE